MWGSGRSETNFIAPLIRLELNAPASPLSAVIRTSSMRLSARCASKGFEPTRSSVAAAAATLPSTCRKSEAYGRAAITRSCARRSLAAETIFMALVICCVFLTERMRRRISIRLGMCRYRRHLRHEARLELLDQRGHLAAQFVVQRLLLGDPFEHRTMGVF